MRIPTSVIVMSLLTAAPFALAVRDELKHKPHSIDDELLGDADSDRRLAKYEAEAAREAELEAEAEARHQQERLAELDTLFGKDKASLGSFLGGAQLGAVADAVESKFDAHYAVPQFVNDKLSAVYIHVATSASESDTSCEQLRAKLTAAWGPSVDGVWINPQTHQRAILDAEAMCSLGFTTYFEPAEWVSLLPGALIGQPTAKLLEKAGPDVDTYDDRVAYTIGGIGYGKSATEVTATIESDKVVGFTITSDTDFDTLVAIRDAISSSRKEQPARDEDSGAWVWKKKPRLWLQQEAGSNQFELRLGKDPYQ